jgi:hypothetical protein
VQQQHEKLIEIVQNLIFVSCDPIKNKIVPVKQPESFGDVAIIHDGCQCLQSEKFKNRIRNLYSQIVNEKIEN